MANDETDEYGGELPELPLTPPHELYFGTVRAIGTPSAEVLESLTSSLSRARVLTELLPLSDQLQRSPSLLRVAPEAFKRLQRDGYAGFMNAGNLLRVSTRRGDAVLSETLAAMDEIRIRSRTTACEPNRTSRAVAYAFKTLVHPEEIRTLRRLYRQTFFSIAIFTPEDSRRRYLSEKLSTRTGARTAEAGQLADRLMASEELNTVDPATPLGQLLRVSPGTSKLLANVEKAYQMADLFIDATERNKVPDQISRFVDLLFGSPWITPTDAELGMGFAYQAALQSGNLSRPVGAAITSPAGDLITIGINDIPRSGGGTQAVGEERDRDVDRSGDVSDSTRRAVFADLLRRLIEDGHLGIDRRLVDEQSLDDIVLSLVRDPNIRKAQIFDVLEYGRTLHAEMDAITAAARRGVSVRGGTLYCTTMPCHECTRLIIAAGIIKVVFVEPFDKSRASVLFADEIHMRSRTKNRTNGTAVVFEPYAGISPRRFHSFFSWEDRKLDDTLGPSDITMGGEKRSWSSASAEIREQIAYWKAVGSPSRLAATRRHEQSVVDEYRKACEGIDGLLDLLD